MKLKILLFLAVGLSVFMSSKAFSQSYLGVQNSNYVGVMGLDNQPASFVDGRFVVDINLFSVNMGVWNNAKKFDTRDMPGWWVKSFRDETNWMKPDSTFADRYLLDNYKLGSKKKHGAIFNTQIDLLNFAFHITPKIALGFGVKARSVVNLEDFSPELIKLAENGFDYSSLFYKQLNDQNLNASMMAWKEYKINYGQVILDKGEHFLKGGIGIKFLQGIGSGYLHSKNVNYGFNNKDTSFLLQGDFSYGYSQNLEQGLEAKDILTGSASRLGVGFDLGFVYEWRPKHQDYKYDMDGKTNIWRKDLNKYKLRAGVSFLDIGGMRYVKGGKSRDFSVNETNPFDMTVFKDADDIETFDKILDSLLTYDPDWTEKESTGKTYFHNLPTAMSLQFDYQIWKDFKVDVTALFNLIPKKSDSRVRVANQITITPSYDWSWVSIHFPLSYNTFSGFKAGVASRLGPITVGITDFRALFAKGKVRGTDIYVGLRVPILYGQPKDKDNDKVSDKKDECKDVPGVWKFMGCPDTDGDGIKDAEDECPAEPGIAAFKGCPDTDGDGIPDKNDNCPEEAGLPQFNGCPDKDSDGIMDKNDECPDVPGIPAFNGCPDSDGDGIPDNKDACPTAAGPEINDGCPDTDGDGILDYIDNCPTVAGPAENNGCPWPDTDNDGVLDKDDKCPTLAGPISNQGCPFQDTDNDGVLDKDDECPATPGPASNKGCPEIEEAVKEILKTAFDNLEFETGKDIIKEVSKPSLDELAGVLVKKPEWKLQIAGHTDNVGKAQSNLILSKKRAEAVRNYLSSKGVDAGRFSVLYFGQTMPIADNNTPEGRQKNRRVEMSIIFE
jgi:outer membrane protein OmpA-like peptidoglycan-associated protein